MPSQYDRKELRQTFRPGPETQMLPLFKGEPQDGPCRGEPSDEPCCGPPAGPPSDPHELPGYRVCSYVTGFLEAPAGAVPRVRTVMAVSDRLGTLRVRIGVGRNDYRVAPGLYAVGRPDGLSPVLVSANYKLSFDHLRSNLAGLDAWVLVLDSCGINVWCAAGKGTFGTAELIQRVSKARLSEVVSHRRLIVPQLGATGVAAHQVRKACGFEVVWGPVRAGDLKAFLQDGQKAGEEMRRVTFGFIERLVLVPVEVYLVRKYLLLALALTFALSGLGGGFFSLDEAWRRGVPAAAACLAGTFAGCVLTPLLLPWIPGRAFALKGALTGLAAALGGLAIWRPGPALGLMEAVALILLSVAVSSNLAMNFTGATPFTSPSGVEKEMRGYIPMQAGALIAAAGIWMVSAFLR